MRGSTAIALSIGIGALIGATVMGVPAIRSRVIPAQVATAPATAPTETATASVTTTSNTTDVATTETTTTAPATDTTITTPATPATPTSAAETAAATTAATVAPAAGTFDVQAALKDRVLGDPNAPVVFYDYSSLSCPHCAQFHNTTLIQIRQRYIDTGKVKMVFRPFPLNEPALLGEKIARCVPEEQYFKVLDLLFQQQDKWVFASDVKDALRQMTKVAGVTDELFNSCMANVELENGIMKIASDGVARHNLKGTPSFIFGPDMPNAEVVAGETTFESFSKRLDNLLENQ